MTQQLLLVGLVLGLCVAYVARRIYITVRRAGDRCYGCKGCALHDQLMKKRAPRHPHGKPLCYHNKK